MIQILLAKPKYVLYALMAILVGYIYYDNLIVPQQEIIRLEQELKERKKVTTMIINKINASDANRTQGIIDETEPTEITIIRDNGVLIF